MKTVLGDLWRLSAFEFDKNKWVTIIWDLLACDLNCFKFAIEEKRYWHTYISFRASLNTFRKMNLLYSSPFFMTLCFPISFLLAGMQSNNKHQLISDSLRATMSQVQCKSQGCPGTHDQQSKCTLTVRE